MRGWKTDSDAVTTRAVFVPAAGAALALGFVGLSTVATAQAPPRFDAISPVQGAPDNPGSGLDAGANGLPQLRRRLPDNPNSDGRTTPGRRGSGANPARAVPNRTRRARASRTRTPSASTTA